MSKDVGSLVSKTLAELINYYEICNRAEGKSLKTVEWYSENLIQFRNYLLIRHLSERIEEINIIILREYVLYLQKRKPFEGSNLKPSRQGTLASASVHGHVRTIRAFYSWLVREEFMKTNIGKDLKPPKIIKKTITILSDDELNNILAVFNPSNKIDMRNQTIFMVLLDTGMRIGELVNLKVDDIRRGECFLKILGKGNKERLVPIGNRAQKALQKYPFRFRPNSAMPNITNVFLTADGHPLTQNGMRLMFSKLAKRAKVDRLHAHLCRHTFATRYLINGGNVFILQQILGHSTLDMVKNYVNLASYHVAYEHQMYSPLDRFYSGKRIKTRVAKR